MRLAYGLAALGVLRAVTPNADAAALLARPSQFTATGAPLAAALAALGWSPDPAPGQPGPGLPAPPPPGPGITVMLLGPPTAVADLTRLQLQHSVDKDRATQHLLFVARACVPHAWSPRVAAPAAPPAGLALPAVQRRQVVPTLEQLWKLPMCNSVKEVYWRLTMVGVSGAGGHNIVHKGPCVCGHLPPTPDYPEEYRIRGALQHAHHFWDCPVAMAVLTEVRAGLHPHVTHLHRSHMWLCIPPCPAVCLAVWRVVCLAAVAAMNEGRKHMWKHHISVAARTLATRRAAVLDAKRAAGRAFWCHLADFVRALPTARRPWKGAGDVTQATPFIAVDDLWPERTYKLVCPPTAVGPELE
jgi:hypothetical protein